MECEKCGVSEDKASLFDVVFEDKLVHMCKRCAEFEDLPVIRKISSYDGGIPEDRHQSVYERMVKISGVKRDSENVPKINPREAIQKKDMTLRDVVERGMKDRVETQPVVMKRPDLLGNYHWIVMRARRSRKMSHVQLADEIGESPDVLMRIERGILPEKDIVLRKLEKALKIRLFVVSPEDNEEYFSSVVDGNEVIEKRVSGKAANLDPELSNALIIGDMKQLDEQTPVVDKVSYWRQLKAKVFGRKKESSENSEEVTEIESETEEIVVPEETEKKDIKNKKDLNSKEINELVFGRKDKK
ncbi:hypothetical protein J4474_02945 [Candidatus Pacearchaeota archaeon]|nr:hypothetical protein [Candidatus Pacearchaeota archaeon]